MKQRLLMLGLVCLLVVGFSVRTTDTVQIPFGLSAAAGWLNNSDGREHPLKGTFTVNKFGHNTDSDTTEDSVWDGSDFSGPIRCFTVPGSSAAALYITSDDEADAAASVTVQALDGNWNSTTIVQTLGASTGGGGGTAVTQLGSVDLLRVNRAFPTTDAVAGNIYIHTDATDVDTDGVPDSILTELVAVIDLVEQQTMQACYTVPLGFTALITRVEVDNADTAANAVATFRVRAATNNGAAKTKVDFLVPENEHRDITYAPPLALPEKTDIELTNVSAANNASVKGRFDLVAVPNR